MAVAEFKGQWNQLAARAHHEQAVWFLNAFWNGGIKEYVEDVWGYVQKFREMAKMGDMAPNDLNEFFSHKFLETVGETMTVLQLRAKLSEIDIDKNKRMCISEYLLFKYDRSAKHLVNAPQGDSDELAKAQALVESATRALDEVLAKLEEQKAAAQRLAKAEADAAEAEAEAKAALDELHKQEKELADKIADLEKRSSEGGVVSRNKAKAELEQLRSEDPLPLRRAKLNQGAALRKSEKARKLAEEQRLAAEEVAAQLEVASKEADSKKQEALAYLDRVKSSGAGAGQVWWLQREMYEKEKYLPKAKQTMAYPKP
jgi:chromosome segregation ATPase